MDISDIQIQKEKLTARLGECRRALKSAGDGEKAMLKAKIASYRASLRDLQVQIDRAEPPAQKGRISTDAVTWDFFERSGVTWSDLEGHSWSQVEAGDFVETGPGAGQLREWLTQGAGELTPKQRLYLDAYYNRGLSLVRIAETMGVDKSSVSRTIRRGTAKLRGWVEARRLAEECRAAERFDWERYLRGNQILTPRQRQLCLLVLSGQPKNRQELAEKLELDNSTVSRTIGSAAKKLQKLQTPRALPTSRPQVRDWDRAGPEELARQAGMGLGFYYRFCCKEHINGLTRYRWELYRRMQAGRSAADTAAELGLQVRTVREQWNSLRRWERESGYAGT